MRYQAIIHYKDDEEAQGPILEDFFEALKNLADIVNNAVISEDGFNSEDVQFAQVQVLED